MNFTSQIRHNPETGKDEKYYRLKESYRNASGNACTRILLNVGFIHGLKPEDIRDISKGLTTSMSIRVNVSYGKTRCQSIATSYARR